MSDKKELHPMEDPNGKIHDFKSGDFEARLVLIPIDHNSTKEFIYIRGNKAPIKLERVSNSTYSMERYDAEDADDVNSVIDQIIETINEHNSFKQ